jgi:hypothetical protein
MLEWAAEQHGIDGSLVISSTNSGSLVYDSHPMLVGFASSFTGTMPFTGDIDELSIWPVARSASEIATDMLTRPLASATGLAGYWPFDEGAGQTAYYGGNQYAVQDQTNGAATSLLQPDLTVEVWANFAAATNFQGILSFPGNSSPAFGLYWHANDYNRGAYLHSTITASGSVTDAAYAWIPAPARWYHLATTYDHITGAHKLYIDEDLVVTTSAIAGSPPDHTAKTLNSGSGQAQNTYSGDWSPSGVLGAIDEVRIWNTARSIDQITADMHTCSPAMTSDLAGYWSFDEGSGQVAHDATSNGNDLQLGNSAAADSYDPTWIDSTVPF